MFLNLQSKFDTHTPFWERRHIKGGAQLGSFWGHGVCFSFQNPTHCPWLKLYDLVSRLWELNCARVILRPGLNTHHAVGNKKKNSCTWRLSSKRKMNSLSSEAVALKVGSRGFLAKKGNNLFSLLFNPKVTQWHYALLFWLSIPCTFCDKTPKVKLFLDGSALGQNLFKRVSTV